MFRYSLVIIVVLILGNIFFASQSYFTNMLVEKKENVNNLTKNTNHSKLDGVYELVSDNTRIISPDFSEDTKTNTEWRELWIFHNGFFSVNSMQIDRKHWKPGKFPDNPMDTGFNGISGTYRIVENKISLNINIAYYPGRAFDTDQFNFSFENDTLILYKTFYPSRESQAEGTQVITLKKKE